MVDRLSLMVVQNYYTSSNLEAVSMFRYWKAAARYCKDDINVIISFPRGRDKERFAKTGFYEDSDDAMRRLCSDNFNFVRCARSAEDLYPEMMFSPINEDEANLLMHRNIKTFDIDMVVMRYGIAVDAVPLMFTNATQFRSSYRPAVVSFFTETGLDESLFGLNTYNAKWRFVIDAIMSDAWLTFNKIDTDWVLKFARDNVSDAVYMSIKKKSKIVKPIGSIDEIDEARIKFSYEEKRKKALDDGKIVIYCSGGAEKKRNWDYVFDFLDAYYDLGGKNMSALFCTPSSTLKSDRVEERLHVESRINHNKDEYYASLSEATIGFAGSRYEGTGFGMIEHAYSGLLMVYLYYDWMNGRILNNYPFVAKDKRELFEIFTQLSVPKDVKKYREEWCPKLIEFYSRFGKPAAVELCQTLKDILKEHIDKTSESEVLLWDVVKKVKKNEFTSIDEFYEEVGRLCDVPKDAKTVKALMSPIGARFLLRKNGYFEDSGRWVKVRGE